MRNACAEYTKAGETFLDNARPLTDREDLMAIDKLADSANTSVSQANQVLEQVLVAESPSGSYTLFTALQNPTPL